MHISKTAAFAKGNTVLKTTIRSTLLCALGVAAMTHPALSLADGVNDISYRFNIVDQTLPQALRNYAQVSGQEIIFTENLFEGAKPVSLKGDFTADDALGELLQGTSLVYERLPSGAIMIKRAEKITTRNGANREEFRIRGGGYRIRDCRAGSFYKS